MLYLKQAQQLASKELATVTATPSLEARLLLEAVTGLEAYQLVTKAEEKLSDEQVDLLISYIARRRKAEPIAYILGEKEFMGERFLLSPAVLIPRPETELLVETVARREADAKCGLDLCTGSGAIALMLLKKLPQLTMTASDISVEALAVARQNADLHNLKQALELVESDLFADIAQKSYDFIVSNPPYISQAELMELMADVRDYEPRLALLAEEDGLAFYRQIAEQAAAYLKNNGSLYLEIGAKQAEAVATLLQQNNFVNIEVIQDLAGLDRIVLASKGEDNAR